MENKVVHGKVVYIFLTASSAEVNFVSDGETQGFEVTASESDEFDKILDFFSLIKKDDKVSLKFEKGQLVAVFLAERGQEISTQMYPNLGMRMKDSAYKKIVAQFVRGVVHQERKRSLLELCLQNAEKSIYPVEADGQQFQRMEEFLKKCQKGDTLRLFQNPEGKITNVVNETQAFEFAC